MGLFKRIIYRKRSGNKDILKKAQVAKSDKGEHTKAFEQQCIINGDMKDSTLIQFIEKHYVASQFADEKINEFLEFIRKSRFYVEYDEVQTSLILAKKMLEGEFVSGSDLVRCRAFAWCSRLLSMSDLDKAEEYLEKAKALGDCPEIHIAEAFIGSKKGDKQNALRVLATLNTPKTLSASLMIVANHDGASAAIDWLESIGANISNLDSDGKQLLIRLHLTAEQWDAAQACLDFITDEDLIKTPALNQVVAITYIISIVPKEFRTVVLSQVPFNAAHFPLADDFTALEARRKAGSYFITASEAARGLSLPQSAKLFDEFALWLCLRDSSQFVQAKEKLIEKLHDPKSALHLVRLGLEFGIKLDLELVEEEIERHIALHGGITQDAAIARFALAFTQKTPEDAANYIARHREHLAKHLDKRYLQLMEIDLLVQAKKPEGAKECLEILIKEGLSEAEGNRLERIIAEIEGANPIDACKEQFKKTNDIKDLMLLVVELEAGGEWSELCEFGEIAFSQTHFLRDAECLAKALYNTHKYERLVNFIKANPDFLGQSKHLQMLYCWALYYEGAILEARSELTKLSEDYDDPNYRSLLINLRIASGDWNSLTAFVAKVYSDKDKRSAQELIGAAQLAHDLGSPNAKELTLAAAEKGSDDAGILLTAYLLASHAGWEDSIEAFQWFSKATELSGDTGPVQKKTIKDVFNMNPDWKRQETETWEALSRGDIPMFVAAELLNRSLINMMLYPAMGNLLENDPRRRGIVPAYSGKRQLTMLSPLNTVAMDATVLLTLSFLKLLDKALDAFETVNIPHSTLNWLFEEKRKASFHQPSRIKTALNLQHLLMSGILEKLIPNAVPDSDLSAQVGDELAQLIAEAEKASNEDIHCIVVCSYPVHRIGSLMDEEVDLTKYETILSSCQAIVDKLQSKGQITVEEQNRARSYLQLHEKPWPSQPEIPDRAILYLDDLAITYFQHLGLLEKMKDAGLRAIVSPRELSEANELTSYERISEQIVNAIEDIRSALNRRIESGKIKVGRVYHTDEAKRKLRSGHPTEELFGLAGQCEAIFVDDRFINQHGYLTIGDIQTPIYSSLEILDIIVSKDSISVANLSGYRTQLRRAGYLFMPVDDKELIQHLNALAIENDTVIESAELKAIRESILRVRMITWLQLPKESLWLDTLLRTFIQVLKELWRDEPHYSRNKALSNWILSQIDVCGWIHCFGKESGENIVMKTREEYVMLLLLPLFETPRNNRNAYWNWLEEMVLNPIKTEYPDLYFSLTERIRNNIISMEGFDLPEGVTRAVMVLAALRRLPPLIHQTLIEDEEFRKDFDLRSDVVISLGDSGVLVQRSRLYDAVRKILSNTPTVELSDKQGQMWELKNIDKEGELTRLELYCDKKNLILPNFNELSSDRGIRLRYFNEVVSNVNLPINEQERWEHILSERSLEDEEVDEFKNDCRDTPVEQANSIHSRILERSISISSLVPTSRRYFERLVGTYDGSTSISDYAASKSRIFFEQLSSWHPYNGFLFSLLLSSHSALTVEINIDLLSKEELIQAFDFLDKNGDIISQLGAIEVGLRVLSSRPEIEPILIRLIEHLRDEDVTEHSGFNLIAALFILVDGELSRIRLFTKEPPFYRRFAALSHASLIYRQIINSGIDISKFSGWAFDNRGEQFYLQSLADMRLEPSWNPELIEASQIKADCLGRIAMAANRYEQNIKTEELRNLIFNDSNCIFLFCQFPYSYYPGPLEGTEDTPKIFPEKISKLIEEGLHSEEVTAKSFIALVNSAMIFRVGNDQAELAAKVLELGSHRLTNVENRSQLLAILNGLAAVAAITRSHILADEIRILVRVYRRDPQYALSAKEVMNICLVAAASCKEQKEWNDFAGEWLTELAFSDLEGDDSDVLHSHILRLCHVVPDLWVSCGRAEAAVMAYNSRSC